MKYRSLNLEAFDYEKEGQVERFSSLIADSPAGGMTKSKAVTVTLPADLRLRLRQLDKRFRTSLAQSESRDLIFIYRQRKKLGQALETC